MRSARPAQDLAKQRPWRLLLWAAVASLIIGVLGIGQVAEDYLRMARNALHPIRASGEIVFVGIDDKSLNQVGKWPWNRAKQGELIDRLTQAGATTIFIDLLYDNPGTPAEDEALAAAMRRSGKVVLADRAMLGNKSESSSDLTHPLERFTSAANGTASASVLYDYRGAVWKIPQASSIAGKLVPSAASVLAHAPAKVSGEERINYRIDPKSIPYVAAADLLTNKAPALRGKTVILGLNADQLGDQYAIPGQSRMAGAYVHVIGAETLKIGRPLDLGWLLPLLLNCALVAAALLAGKLRWRGALLLGSAGLLMISPYVLETWQIFIDVMPALATTLIASARLTYLRVSRKALVNDDTGLPNLPALRALGGTEKLALVVARIHNFSELSATLSDAERQETLKQIVGRLNASGSTKLFHTEDATLAWLVPPDQAIGNHLEALHALFRTPVALDKRQIDAALTFGVELGSVRSISNRLGSAALAADEAWEEGLRWKLHDPSRQEEMNWRVSLLGELDAAIDQGEVWLAYQPQYDLRRGQIVGAEALARWTHPQKGPISPSEFVAAAENSGRIAKLTDFVLDRAIGAAAAINRRGIAFQVAVNLSARLLTDRELLNRVKQMLATHGLAADKLTLELTETASLQDAESGLHTLDALRRMGVRVAIDDYGTGLSTLEYLKKIPANEIKIDQSFVKSMRVNRSDLIMVQSTIALAHSLGRTVVAEGVEDKQCLEELTGMGCDVAQGFIIGRPMGVRELVQRLQIRSTRRVA